MAHGNSLEFDESVSGILVRGEEVSHLFEAEESDFNETEDILRSLLPIENNITASIEGIMARQSQFASTYVCDPAFAGKFLQCIDCRTFAVSCFFKPRSELPATC